MPPACFRGEAPWMDSYTPWMGRKEGGWKGEMGGECGGERQAIEMECLEDERGGRNARRHSDSRRKTRRRSSHPRFNPSPNPNPTPNPTPNPHANPNPNPRFREVKI